MSDLIKSAFKLIRCLAIFSFVANTALAQSANTYMNNYVQPAPNAASLGQYADYPISYYTGTPQISVPIYNLNDGSLHIPISLTYHASGIKVSENASWVGLGWALNAGGVIIRTVRGAPDEGTRKSYSSATGPGGYYRDKGLTTMPKLPYSGDPSSYNAFNMFFIPAVNFGAKDCEPDLYTFNFNGYAGKFVFDEYQNVRLLTDDNLKITVSYSDSEFKQWMITTPDGIQYYFGENSVHEVNYPYSKSTDGDVDALAPASWYLTRIVNPNTKETALLTYTPEYYSYRDIGPETKLYGSGPPGGPDDIERACSLSDIDPVANIITTGVYGQALQSIVTKNYTVKFIAGTPRTDLIQGIEHPATGIVLPPSTPGPHNTNSLDGISIYSNSVCIKQFALAYDYFTSTTATSDRVTTALTQYDNDVTDTKRLKLVSVTEKNGDGTVTNPAYTFSYDETQQLPRRLSFDQDHWGYSNNSIGSVNRFFTWKNDAALCSFGGPLSPIRESAWPAMRAFTLMSIVNPLGVTTNFQFEANNYSGASEPIDMVGGLRVHQIQTTDNVTGVVGTKKLDYSAGGILYTDPKSYYTIILDNEYYHTGTYPNPNGGYNGYGSHGNLIFNILRSSQTIVPLHDPQGNHISYPFVKEIYGANGENGYRTYRYSVERSPSSNSSRLDMYHYTDTLLVDGFYGIFGNGTFNEVAPEALGYYTPYNPTNYYPVAPQQVDIVRGNLLNASTYDASGNLIESVENTYDETLHENYWIRGFKAYRAHHTPGSGGAEFDMDALTYYKFHTGISHLMSTTRNYKDSGKMVTETTNYSYESPYHTLPTTTTHTNSNGDVILQQNFYSFDLSASASSVFPKMSARNLLLPTVQQTWKNGKLMSGSVTEFQDFATVIADTLVYPAKIHALETNTLLTPAQAGENPTWFIRETLLPNSLFKERADFSYDGTTAKPLNEKLVSGPDNSYQWGYNDTYPVAKLVNAANTYHVADVPGPGGTGITIPKGGTQTYIVQFDAYQKGPATFQIGFSGNPGTNPLVQISCILIGPNGYNHTFQLCLCGGTASCGAVPSTVTINDLLAGSYSLSASYYQATNQNSDVRFTVTYPSHTITPSGIKEFYYEGFEDSTPSGLVTGTGHTGNNYMGLSPYVVSWTVPNARAYVISYWYLSATGWIYSGEIPYTGTSYTLSNPGATGYDDIRIYPKDAQMSTYTYDPSVGMTSSTDAKNEVVYYEYDSFQRLINIRDKNHNIVKHLDYHFQNQ